MRQLEPSPEPEKPISESRKIIEVVIGFVGWYVINGLFWLGVPGGTRWYGVLLAIFTLPANLIVLLVCAIKPRLRKVALGILIAVALNLVISLVLGMMTNAICFVPFFNK